MIKSITITLSDDTRLNWDFDFTVQGTMRVSAFLLNEAPEWIRLEHSQCPACTLEPRQCPICPVAEVLAEYAHELADRKSYERVKVDVFQDDAQRLSLENIPLQTVVRELVRLAVFQYECPIGRTVKTSMTTLPPFPTNDEILHAFATAFAAQSGANPGDLNDEQRAFLDSLHDLFACLSARLENVGHGDAHLNGIVILHSLAVLFTLSAPDLIRALGPTRSLSELG